MTVNRRGCVAPQRTNPPQTNPPPNKKASLCLCLLLLAMVPATFSSEQSLEEIIEDHWQWVLQQYPERRLEYGDRSGNGQWTDNSLAAFQQRYQDEGAFVARLEQIEPATLGHDARINRNMLMRQLRENRRRFEDGG